ncbi:unnamed protein product [Adineta steineri]|uniref:Uncharacterized protein n=2 Tax=Adineta steineri TaxID=433720 RepID=A0A818TB96_9BILA|nr:unnamed protein product [Adineta steineri]
MPQVHEYLLGLLNYFYWFFEITNNTSLKTEQHIDYSQMEKNRIHIAYAHLLASLRELSCKYAILLLGTDLKDFHHMRNGDLFYSCTNIDRTIHESLFILSTYLIWITFYRQNFDLIQIELARLFRAGSNVETIKIPITESLEGRIKNEISNVPMARHKLIDCTEFFSKTMAKKAAIMRTSEVSNKNLSIQRASSMFWKSDDISHLQNRVKNFNIQEENDELYALGFDDKSPYYRQKHKLRISQHKNRIRSILTKQFKNRNENLIDEQHYQLKSKNINEQPTKEEIKNKIQEKNRTKDERVITKQFLSSSSYKHSFMLPAPPNPLNDSHRMKEKQVILPKIQFKLIENIGIIGKPYSDFDLIRLILKPNIENNITIPTEFLVTIPNVVHHS